MLLERHGYEAEASVGTGGADYLVTVVRTGLAGAPAPTDR